MHHWYRYLSLINNLLKVSSNFFSPFSVSYFIKYDSDKYYSDYNILIIKYYSDKIISQLYNSELFKRINSRIIRLSPFIVL